jgi:hypothetical protein
MQNLDSILLALFCFLMGATVVGGVVYLRANAEKRPPSTGGSSDTDLVEVARLWRNHKTNQLVVEIDGQFQKSAGELDPNQQQRMATASGVLQTWLGRSEPTSPFPVPLPTVSVSQATQPIQPPTRSNTAPPIFPVSEVVKPVAPKPLEAIGRILAPNPAQAATQFKSITTQINEVLQARLSGSPFEAIGIELMEAPDKGVVVRVGSEHYPGIDAIPDTAVRNYIKAAVAEWEAKTRSGIR